MIRLDAAGGVVGVDVEGVQVSADLRDWSKGLCCAGGVFQDVGFCGEGFVCHFFWIGHVHLYREI